MPRDESDKLRLTEQDWAERTAQRSEDHLLETFERFAAQVANRHNQVVTEFSEADRNAVRRQISGLALAAG